MPFLSGQEFSRQMHYQVLMVVLVWETGSFGTTRKKILRSSKFLCLNHNPLEREGT